ncbi:hypothetical protein Pve01_08370 [Planomonospora venezuelensis]|nr:hypothetical protein Pve01_08370 [Planomonospora venezuelensis]
MTDGGEAVLFGVVGTDRQLCDDAGAVPVPLEPAGSDVQIIDLHERRTAATRGVQNETDRDLVVVGLGRLPYGEQQVVTGRPRGIRDPARALESGDPVDLIRAQIDEVRVVTVADVVVAHPRGPPAVGGESGERILCSSEASQAPIGHGDVGPVSVSGQDR